MTTIEEMKLFGLRSFSPHEEEIQTVKFSSPLTLILGENGCGKTTLIEALKFACSGDTPGGSKTDFVNDPKLSDVTSAQGQVQLKFADITGDKYTVTKSVRVTNRGVKPVFNRLTTSLKHTSTNGTTERVTLHGDSLDKDICRILGVSKSILNNVIFCHQEDTAWPLGEPKKLKEKFDKIFDAVEYNTCVERFMKAAKKQQRENQVLSAGVDKLKKITEAVDKKRKEEQDKTEKFNKLQDVISGKETSLLCIAAKLQEISVLEKNRDKLQLDCTKNNTKKEEIIKQQTDILNNIAEQLADSEEELQTRINTFDINRGKIKDKQRSLEKKKQNRETARDQLTTTVSQLQIRMGKLQGEKNQHKEIISERNNLIQKIANLLQIQTPTFEPNDVLSIIDSIHEKIECSKASLDNLSREFESEESQLQESIYEKRNELSKVNHSIETKQQQIQELKEKLGGINYKLQELDYADEQFKLLQNKINILEKDLNSHKTSFDADAASKQIEENKQKIRQEEEKQEMLEREYKVLQQNSVIEAELSTQHHECIKRKSQIGDLKDKHFQNLNTVFDIDIPAAGFMQRRVESERQKNTSNVNDINKKISLKQEEATTLEAKCKFQREKLQCLEKELKEGEKQVFELCKGRQFEVMSKEFQQAIEKLRKDKGQNSFAMIMYEKFVQDFQSQNPCCPLCHTDFNTKQAAVTEIIKTIRSKIQGIPQQLKKVEEELKSKQEQYTNLLQLKPVNEKIEELNTTLIPKSKADLITCTSFYERINNELSDLKEQLIKPQSIVNACNEISGAAALMNQYQHEINESEINITKLRSQLMQVASSKSKLQAEKELEVRKTNITNIRTSSEALQNKLLQHNKLCQQLREEKSKHLEKLLQFQKVSQLVELTNKEQILKTEIIGLQKQLYALETDLQYAYKNQETVKKSNSKKVNDMQEDLNLNQKRFDDITKLQRSVDAYVAQGGDGAFEAALQELVEFEQKIVALDGNMKQILSEITEVNRELVNQDAVFRNLNDNLYLRKKHQQEEQLLNQIMELECQIGHYEAILKEKEDLLEQKKVLQTEIDTCKGMNKVLEQDLKTIKEELNTADSRQAHTNYKVALVEYMCAEKMVDDIKKYIKAVEHAVLQFHKERMTQINTRIRQFWRSIYRGNDCDYIEIKTDETDTTPDLRRTYNYKVVQMKMGVETDMHGRCSAGQKMLACLIIRMALAETFSKNCGILALDEPTTNLDRANITSLSDTLARIVNSPQTGKNFQLLIITHDEEFLSTLTRVDKVSHFLRVHRDEKGNSVLTQELL